MNKNTNEMCESWSISINFMPARISIKGIFVKGKVL